MFCVIVQNGNNVPERRIVQEKEEKSEMGGRIKWSIGMTRTKKRENLWKKRRTS